MHTVMSTVPCPADAIVHLPLVDAITNFDNTANDLVPGDTRTIPASAFDQLHVYVKSILTIFRQLHGPA